MGHGVDAVGREGPVGKVRHGVDAQVQQRGEGRADDIEGQVEDQQHHAEEHRQGGMPPRKDAVRRQGALVLPALMALHHGVPDHALDELVAHVGQGRVPVQASLRLHLHDAVLQQLLLVLVQAQALRQGLVPLDELRRAEAGGDVEPVGVVRDEVHHGVEAAVHRGIRPAEVRHLGQRPGPNGLHRLVDELADALVPCGGDGHHRNAERLTHLPHVDGAAVGVDLVHHVQGQDHGRPQLQELQCQVEVPLDVGGVHDVDDAVGLLVQDEIPGDDLLLGVGPQGVDAGEVHHCGVLHPPDLAGLPVHRDAGEVAHMLVGARQGVEEGGLAAVLVAGQGEDHRRTSILAASSRRSVSS